jgi:hypothetical protein
MGLKNINIFEQHAEKIVLGLAAAGALAMGYMATGTVGFTDPKTNKVIGPNDVEKAINADAVAMDKQREELEAQGRPNPKVEDFVAKYRRLSSDQPLDAAVLASRFPEFAPRNLRPGATSITPVEMMASVIPEPPAPEYLHAEVLTLSVAPQTVGPDGAPVPPAAGQYVTQTHNVVVIDGWVPVGKMVLQMLKEPDVKKRFREDVTHGVVYRIRVQRQDRSSGKSKWEDVPPAKGAPAPRDILVAGMADGALPEKLADIGSQFQWIQLPPYYVDAQGNPFQPPILSKPVPARVAAEIAQLHTDLEAARASVQPGVGPRLTGGVPATNPVEAGMPNTIDGLRAMEVQPFTFWDDSVKPDHSYRYQVQVQLVNPAFGWKWGLGPNQKVSKADPVIPLDDEKFVAVPGMMVVHPDIAFFVRGLGMGSSSGITGPLFKQDGGRWYLGSFSAPRGVNIAATMTIAGKSQDVDTKFTVVDYQESGNSVHVVLKDPNGNLVTRDSAEDGSKSELNDLMDKVRQGAAAAPVAPAPAEGPGTPVPPTTGRSTPTPPVSPTTRRGLTPVPVR